MVREIYSWCTDAMRSNFLIHVDSRTVLMSQNEYISRHIIVHLHAFGDGAKGFSDVSTEPQIEGI